MCTNRLNCQLCFTMKLNYTKHDNVNYKISGSFYFIQRNELMNDKSDLAINMN